MDYAYSITMFAIAIGLLLYAMLLGLTKDHTMIRRWQMIKMNDPKHYAVQFAKGMALMAAAFTLSGIVGLFLHYIVAVIVLVLGFVGGIILLIKLVKDA